MTQTNLLPLDASPLSTTDGRDIDEVLNYGTDADCRLALIALMESLPEGIDSVDKLIGKYAELTDKVETLECDVYNAEEERYNEIEHGRELHTVANDLAMRLTDVMAAIKGQALPGTLWADCEKAIDTFEEV